MTTFYEEIEIEDFVFDEEKNLFHYPCPCGDRFEVTLDQLYDGEEIARCPSCSLIVRVIYDPEDFMRDGEDEEGETFQITKVVSV